MTRKCSLFNRCHFIDAGSVPAVKYCAERAKGNEHRAKRRAMEKRGGRGITSLFELPNAMVLKV